MTEKAKQKAEELFDKYYYSFPEKNRYDFGYKESKRCALICVENQYKSLREQLFNLRACKVIESEKTYLYRLQELQQEEKQVKQHLEEM